MQPKPAHDGDVGVLVGRFQVHMLHEGHRKLIEWILRRHQQVIIFLGSTSAIGSSRRNPLDFRTRRAMIAEKYPEVTILPLSDHPSDKAWSDLLDDKIREATFNDSIVLYGSRDSFVSSYSGCFPVVELEATHPISGTEIRESVAKRTEFSNDFRQGIIYSAFNRRTRSDQVVDCCMIDNNGRVLVARKPSDPPGYWRFPGGYVDPSDKSLEAAASRELFEETRMCSSSKKYLGSLRIDDWRYRSEDDKMMTAVYVFEYETGSPEAHDDINQVSWQLIESVKIHPNHEPILSLLKCYTSRTVTN